MTQPPENFSVCDELANFFDAPPPFHSIMFIVLLQYKINCSESWVELGRSGIFFLGSVIYWPLLEDFMNHMAKGAHVWIGDDPLVGIHRTMVRGKMLPPSLAHTHCLG